MTNFDANEVEFIIIWNLKENCYWNA